MSPMLRLLRLFSSLILKLNVVFCFGAIVGVLALDKLFGGYEFYLGMLVFIAPIMSWVVTFMLVPKNLDWIMSLPISKRNVLVLHYLTSVFSSIVAAVSSVFALLVLAVLKSDKQLHAHHFSKAAMTLASEVKLGSKGVQGMDLYGWMLLLLMLSFFHALSMSISRPALTKRLYLNLFNHPRTWVRWSLRLGWLPLLLLAAFYRDSALSPFGVFVLASFGFPWFTTFNTTHALALPRRQKWFWFGASGAIAVAQVGFLLLSAIQGLSASSFDARVSSVMFLGPLSGGMAKADFIQMLESDLSDERVQELGALYRKKFADGRKLNPAGKDGLDFKKIIGSKKTQQAVAAVAALFESADYGAAEIEALFQAWASLNSGDSRLEYPGFELARAKLLSQDEVRFLQEKNEPLNQFALLWARYNRDSAFIPVIESALPAYSDKLKLLALKTLSVLYGRRFSFNDWLEARRGLASPEDVKPHLAGFYEVDCKVWSVRSLEELENADPAALNACIRAYADISLIAEVESLGWIQPPFDVKSRNIIKRALRLSR